MTRDDVEALLYREAELLDAWKLRDWAAMFTEDGEYLVPSTDLPDGKPGETLFLVYDDRHRLEQRAERLMKKTAHAEYPHSRTRHMISNVQIKGQNGDVVVVHCNFVVYRSRNDRLDVYPGHSLYELRTVDREARIRLKRAMLDTETLRAQHKISIIL